MTKKYKKILFLLVFNGMKNMVHNFFFMCVFSYMFYYFALVKCLLKQVISTFYFLNTFLNIMFINLLKNNCTISKITTFLVNG